MKTVAQAKKIMGLIRDMITLGTVVSPNGKAFHDKIYSAKQKVKI